MASKQNFQFVILNSQFKLLYDFELLFLNEKCVISYFGQNQIFLSQYIYFKEKFNLYPNIKLISLFKDNLP